MGVYKFVTLETIFANTKHVGECWEWQGYMARKKHEPNWIYPIVDYYGKQWRGNRLVWTLIHGPIEKGLCIMHKCDNTKCINPNHLKKGTLSENIRDAVEKKRHSESRKTHCKYGHPLSGKNLRTERPKGRNFVRRVCRSCKAYRFNGLQIPFPKEVYHRFAE